MNQRLSNVPHTMLPSAAIGRFALVMMAVVPAVLLTSHTLALVGVSDAAPGSIKPSVVWQDLMNLNQEHAPALLKGIQLEDGRHVELSLEPFNIMAEDGLAVIAGKHGEQFLAEEDLVHLYRGTLQSDADTQVFLAATDKRMNGFIRIGDETHIISSGPITPWKSETLYVTALSRTIDDWIAEGPFCRFDEIEQPFELAIPFDEDPAPLPAGACTVIEVAVDSDWEFTNTLFGGDAEASEAYAITLTAAVSEIYVEDMQVRLQLNYVRTWTSNTDPYTNPNNRLDEFQSHWTANMTSVDRDIAHLLSAPFSGGLAFGSVLCNPTWGYAVSGSLDGVFPYPLQDNHWQNWDLVVMAHELGHNFGCSHTHALGIDGCGFGDCTDAHLGTIMSYCHLCPGGMTNISLSFHPQNRTQMNNLFNRTSCDVLGDCTEVPVGACCIQTVCLVVAEDVCGNGGGTWLGDGTNCADDPCELIEPVGGCCDDTSCDVTTESDCVASDGSWLGEGTDCAGDPCDTGDPTGGCCVDFTCSITIEAQCGGTWLGDDTTCDGDPCAPVGACCRNGTCSITSLADCGGTWQGAGTDCFGDPCNEPDPSGACCNDTECSITTEAGCSGIWRGDGTDCEDNPCDDFLRVPESFPTIQAAISSASDGNVILVSPGTYTSMGPEVVNTRGLLIEIRSSGGPGVTIIDGEGLRPVVVCTEYETADTIINGFTITGGVSSGWGGGIFCRKSSPTFTNCIITDNMAPERGGGTYLHLADATFNGCTWTSNMSDTGAGIYSALSSPVLTDCSFADNSAFISGGAIYAVLGDLTIADSDLCHNLPDHISGDWTDAGGNSMLDECEVCSGDIGTVDGVVDQLDVQALLELWGTDDEGADIDGDGVVGIGDLLTMLTSWGPC